MCEKVHEIIFEPLWTSDKYFNKCAKKARKTVHVTFVSGGQGQKHVQNVRLKLIPANDKFLYVYLIDSIFYLFLVHTM